MQDLRVMVEPSVQHSWPVDPQMNHSTPHGQKWGGFELQNTTGQGGTSQ